MILAEKLNLHAVLGRSIANEFGEPLSAQGHCISGNEFDNGAIMRRSAGDGKQPRSIAVVGQLKAWASAAVVAGSLISVMPASAQALKGAGTCNDEYKANRSAIRAAKELKKDFVAACRALPPGTPTPIGGGAGAPATPTAPAGRTSDVGTYKTAGQCNDEYKAAKAALKSAKEKKKDFVASCRALPPGTQTPINGGAPVPAPAPSPSVTPAPAPAPSSPAAPAPTTQRQAPPPRTASSSPTGANQFPSEAGAKARCPSATVVWVNTKSGIYHFAGTKNYGNTKSGAYMCETDATAAGDRASKREKHP